MASPSVTESSDDQNTDDERFIDDGDSTDDDDFIYDGHVDNQYSSSSSFEVSRLVDEKAFKWNSINIIFIVGDEYTIEWKTTCNTVKNIGKTKKATDQ